jgi:hypothetical protein
MQSELDRVSRAWRDAAADLGIRVTAPYTETDGSSHPIEFLALVHDFGSPRGTLVTSMHAPRPQVSGYFVSGVNPGLYATYDRQSFVDALEDWGWYGEGSPPAWYTGVSPWR